MKEEIEFEDITNESENLIQAHDITEEDILLIKNAGEELVDELPKLLDSFYAWLKTTPEFEIFFSDPGLLKEVVKLQQKYWMDFYTTH